MGETFIINIKSVYCFYGRTLLEVRLEFKIKYVLKRRDSSFCLHISNCSVRST